MKESSTVLAEHIRDVLDDEPSESLDSFTENLFADTNFKASLGKSFELFTLLLQKKLATEE